MKPNKPALTAFVIALLVSFVSIDQSPIITHPFQAELKSVANRIMPQGWGFFTKSVESEQYKFYDDSLILITRGKNSAPSNMFGFNRETRLAEIENSYLLNQLKEEDWTICIPQTLEECYYKSNRDYKKIVNNYNQKIYCGNFTISAERATPWSWRLNKSAKIPHPEKIINVEIEC